MATYFGRREFIFLLGGTAMCPIVARAQQTDDKLRRIGLLLPYSEGDAEGKARLAAFNQKLQELMLNAFHRVRLLARERQFTMRSSALSLGVQKVAKEKLRRGLFP